MNKINIINPFKKTKHKHKKCIKSAVINAQKICGSSGLRLTPLRQRVLELVWGGHEPIGAYDILDKLKTEHQSSAPPTVYRALDFLKKQGLIHKIESFNAYIGCSEPSVMHKGQFLICHKCNNVAELNDADISNILKEKADSFGFTIENETIEIKGFCKTCYKNKEKNK